MGQTLTYVEVQLHSFVEVSPVRKLPLDPRLVTPVFQYAFAPVTTLMTTPVPLQNCTRLLILQSERNFVFYTNTSLPCTTARNTNWQFRKATISIARIFSRGAHFFLEKVDDLFSRCP